MSNKQRKSVTCGRTLWALKGIIKQLQSVKRTNLLDEADKNEIKIIQLRVQHVIEHFTNYYPDLIEETKNDK